MEYEHLYFHIYHTKFNFGTLIVTNFDNQLNWGYE